MPEPTEAELCSASTEWLSAKRRIKPELSWWYASLRQPRVRRWAAQFEDLPPLPDRMQLGERGNNSIMFFTHVIPRERVRNKRLAFIGCGNGEELLLGAHFGAAECVGIEFLSFDRSWALVRNEADKKYPGTRLQFVTVDSIDPEKIAAAIPQAGFDLALSFAVLEHVRDLRGFLRNVRALLGADGALFSVWGPMWWAYGGDHIAPDDGFDQGFVHLKLSDDEYDKWYRAHPRNRATVEAGIPTWKDLDLYSFLRYREYDDILKEELHVTWRHWIWSEEAVEYDRRFPGEIDQLAATHRLARYDLFLKSAAVFATMGASE